jgi:hypothetical protein
MYDDVQKTGNWIFVIDTDHYAGNFEREMTAYITGTAGDCGVGKDMFPYYTAETGDENREKFEDWLEFRADDHGCSRPCAIYSTPGWFNDGMGGHFKDGEEEKALKNYIKQCEQIYGKEYMANPLRAKEALEKGEKYSNWTMPAVNDEIKRLNKQVEQARNLKKVGKYPAYLSVAIFFYKKPTPELIEFLKERANKYHLVAKKENKKKGYKSSPEGLKIDGFRLIKENLTVKEEKV